MTDRKQFEAMLEALVNDNTEKARDIFQQLEQDTPNILRMSS